MLSCASEERLGSLLTLRATGMAIVEEAETIRVCNLWLPLNRKSRITLALFTTLVYFIADPFLYLYASAEDVHIAQMVHTSWTAQNGAPQRTNALAEAPDGNLWIGADGGLYRFDGLNFVSFHSPPGDQSVPSTGVQCLLSAQDGTLWAGTDGGGLVEIQGGHVRVINNVEGERIGQIETIRQGADGSIWALAEYKVIHLGSDRAWRWAGRSLGMPDDNVRDLISDDKGTLWFALENSVVYYKPSTIAHALRTTIPVGVEPHFAQTSDGTLWLADLSGKTLRGRLRAMKADMAHPVSVELSRDENRLFPSSDGSLWVLPAAKGLVRIRVLSTTRLIAYDNSRSPALSFDFFNASHGLSSDTITAAIEDAEGNIWTAGVRGLDRFQHPRMNPLPLRAPNGELPAIDADSEGTLWIGVPASGLYSLRGEKLRLEYGKRDYLGVFCGPDHLLWFDDDFGLWRARSGKTTFVRPLFPATSVSIFGLVQQDRDVAYASFQGRHTDHDLNGVFRTDEKQWRKLDFAKSQIKPTEPSLAGAVAKINESAPTALMIDSHHRLWGGHVHGLVTLLDGSNTAVFSSGDPGLGTVMCLLESKEKIFAAGINGIAVWRNNSFRMLRFWDTDIASGISGLVQARDGDLWLNGRRGIGRISVAELNSGLSNPQHQIQVDSITEGDFVGPAPIQLRHPTAFSGRNGMLWFVAPDGTLVGLDPDHLTHPPVPHLSITGMVTDGVPVSSPTRIPQRTQILRRGSECPRQSDVPVQA